MGPLLSTHAVTRSRFGAAVALTVSLLCSLLVVLAFVLDLGGAELALLAAGFPMLISVPAAAVMGRNAVRREVFELHEGGLARIRSGVRQAWTWDQVHAIDLSARGEELVWAVRFDDGELMRFTSSDVDDSLAINDALGEHCLDALDRPAMPNRGPAVMGAIFLACAGGAGAAVYAVLHTEVPEKQFGFAMVGAVGTASTIVTLILLVAVLRAPRPRLPD